MAEVLTWPMDRISGQPTLSSFWAIPSPHTPLAFWELEQQVQTTAAAVWDRQFQKEIQLGRAGDDVEGFRPRPIREQRDSHVVLPRVPNKVAFEFRRLAEQLPGLEVQDAQRRDYPWSTAEVTLDRSTLSHQP